jgi:hypothetical protein
VEEGEKGGKGIDTGVGHKSQDAVLLEIIPNIFLNAKHFSFWVIFIRKQSFRNIQREIRIFFLQ